MNTHLPNPFDSALVSAMSCDCSISNRLNSELRAGSATVETNIPVSAVVANSFAPSLPAERAVAVASENAPVSIAAATSNPELAEVSRADPLGSPQRGTPMVTRSPGIRGKKDQASFEPASSRIPPLGVETTAGASLSFAPAAFSLDLRIHNIMLAVADELADEQRTINERLLLQQFAPQLRQT